MSRIRTVKPELFKHEQLFDAELECKLPLRLTFIGLFTKCDREGRFKWRPRELKLDIIPYDEVDFNAVLEALKENKFIVQYESNGELFGCIPSWHKHQVINNREAKSTLPDPGVISTRDPHVVHALATSLLHAQGEGKGKRKEEKGKEYICKVPDGTLQPSFCDESIVELFNYWQERMNHPRAKLDKTRQKKIRDAFKLGFNIEQLKSAIDGCAKTPFNVGINPSKQRYDSIDLIFRDAEHIERFMQSALTKEEDQNVESAVNQMHQIAQGAM